MTAETVDLITDDTEAVQAADTLVITDRRGQRLILSRVDDRFRIIAAAGVDIHRLDTARVVEFLGGESLARDLELALQRQGTLRARVEELEDVVREILRAPDVVGCIAPADSPLYRARVALGLDGASGHRDINAEVRTDG